MRSTGLICAAALAALAYAQASRDPGSAPETPRVRGGGLELNLPPPDGFADVGEQLRTILFELMAPSSNRLLTAYAPPAVIAQLKKASGEGMELYAMIQVPRRAEYEECTTEIFKQVAGGLEDSIGKFDGERLSDLDRELNLRLKSLGAKPLELGSPKMLGAFFRGPDAAGFGMLTGVKEGDRTVQMVNGLAALRLKQRLVFAYLYRRYESPETVQAVRKALQTWADALLAANR